MKFSLKPASAVVVALCLGCVMPAQAQSLFTRGLKAIGNSLEAFGESLSSDSDASGQATPKAQKGGVKVTLTGTLKEPVTMTVGESRKETITKLPYTFFVAKSLLPHTVTFSSPNYEYTDVTVNKKEQGGIGRTYLLKSVKKSVAAVPAVVQQQMVAAAPEKPQVDWAHGVNQVPETGVSNESTFALIIANEEYENAAPVAMANQDGEVFKAYCEKTLGLTENQIKYYPNATYGKMSRAFREIKDIAEAFDGDINLIVYYAGHGIPDNATKDAYILPVDADGSDMSVCYSLQKMYKDIEALHLNQCVVFMDACFSGAKRDGDMIVAARGVALKPKAAKPTASTVVFSATSDEQAAYSYAKEKHGLFTYFLLKKLQESKGKATLGEISDYLSTQVGRNSIVINGKKQTPTTSVPDALKDSWRNLRLAR